MPRHDRSARDAARTGQPRRGAAPRQDRRDGPAPRQAWSDSSASREVRPDGRAGRPGRTDLAALRARLRGVVEPAAAAAGYDVEGLSVSRAGRRHVVRIMVDADGGVTLDEVAELSRDLSAALDAAEETGGDFGTGEYVLEVGSPGVDRPLTRPRHWRRAAGRMVTVRAGGQQVTGRVVAADERSVTLDVDRDQRVYPLAELGPGRVQIEFGRLDEFEDDGDGDVTDGPASDGRTADEEREEDEE